MYTSTFAHIFQIYFRFLFTSLNLFFVCSIYKTSKLFVFVSCVKRKKIYLFKERGIMIIKTKIKVEP